MLASLWKLPNWIQWLANFVFDCTLVLCSGPNLLPVEMYADIYYTVWHVCCAVSIKGNFGISGMNFDTDYRLFFMRLHWHRYFVKYAIKWHAIEQIFTCIYADCSNYEFKKHLCTNWKIISCHIWLIWWNNASISFKSTCKRTIQRLCGVRFECLQNLCMIS